MRELFKPFFAAFCVAAVSFWAIGCTYNGDAAPQSTTRPADAALKDPYGKWGSVNTDISGGGISNLNRDALKRDTDSFLLK